LYSFKKETHAKSFTQKLVTGILVNAEAMLVFDVIFIQMDKAYEMFLSTQAFPVNFRSISCSKSKTQRLV